MTEPREPTLAPETDNSEQEDEEAQAQTVAEEARAREPGLSDSEKAKTGDESDDSQDLVDHMRQMDRSGRIDMSAFRGERNDDDEEGMLGPDGDEE